MRKMLIAALAVLLVGIFAWGYFGGIDRVTENRIRTALVEQGVPEPYADCIAVRLVDRLTLQQLRSLERAAPRDQEAALPTSFEEALGRLSRVDDPEAVEITLKAGFECAIGSS